LLDSAEQECLPDRVLGAAPGWLPTDRPRHRQAGGRRAVERLSLAPSTVAEVGVLMSRLEVSRLAVLLTALYGVLHRHTGDSDLAVATPAADADPPVVATWTDPAGSFADLCTRAHQAVLDAVASKAVTAGRPAQVLITWPGGDQPPGQRAAGFDLWFSVRETGEDVVVELDYDSELFEPATAARLLRHYTELLRLGTRDPDRPVGTVPLRPEPAPLAWSLPAPAGYQPVEPAHPAETLVDRFRKVVAAHGQRVAVRGRAGEYTYTELDRRSDAVAARLAPRIPPGGRVGVLCEHDIGSVAGVWSVLKAGAAYVPLDPRHPDGWLARQLSSADVHAVLCDPALLRRASALAAGTRVISLAAGTEECPDQPDPESTSDSLAYLLHTSGSTGRPKAVMQTQRNMLWHALTYAARLRIGPGDVLASLARITVDAAVMDHFGAALTGATLCLVDPNASAPAALLRALASHAPTVLHCTPTLFRLLFTGNGTVPASLDTVRAVVLGGEEATPEDVRAFFRQFGPDCALVNGLGPTECTLAAQYLVRPGDERLASVPVGFPIEGIGLELVDAGGRVTEVFGELVIRGRAVAAGYWNEPEHTAAAFGVGPDGVPRYRTGDLARRRADGALVFAGRKDQQVKIRGHRVEPAEPEALLRAHPTVAHAVVVSHRPANRVPQLLGYVTSASVVPADPSELTDYLRRHLPEVAVPTRVVVLARLPVGPTGKLDVARLPIPDDEDPVSGDLPSTPVQAALVEIWREVLGRDSAGIRHSFLATGADSVQVMQLLGRVEVEFGVDIPLREFLGSPTIETLAEFVEKQPKTSASR
jgi:amino acid adenylation domain-containing protein